MWEKIIETKDVISFKKTKKNFSIVIEARHTDNRWDVYKTYRYGKDNYVQEYSIDSREEAINFIDTLKLEKDIPIEKLREIKKLQSKKIFVNLERAYKEYEVEKWFFYINEEEIKNFVTIRYSENLQIDIIMHERYKLFEKQILDRLNKSLHLNEFGSIRYEIYYYKENNSHKIKGTGGFLLNKIQMDFGIEE